MKVENVGNKKAWIALFSVLGVVIAGLIIAIIVVVATRSKPEEIAQEDSGALAIYLNGNEEITKIILGEKLESEATLGLISEKIEMADNDITKAMLKRDYYLTMLSIYGADESKKDEILNGLIWVEDILQTSDSAENLVNAALAYQDFDLYRKYITVAKERDPSYQSIYDITKGASE